MNSAPILTPRKTLARPLALGCLALSMALAGCYVALSKPLVAALPVFLLAWLRFGIGAVAMAGWLRKPPGEPPVTWQTQKWLFFESFVGNFLFSVCMLYGVSMTSAVSAGVIMASIPAVVALMSWVVLRERFSARTGAAIACAALGVAILSLYKQELTNYIPRGLEANLIANSSLWGNLLVFAAVVCEAAYAVIGKKLTFVLSPKRIAALINLWGFALMTPLGLYAAMDFNFRGVAPGHWALLVFYALAASVWTVWLWMTGLNTVPAAQAGVFTVMLPIAAALTGVLLLGEPFSPIQGIAFAIAIWGVVLATLPAGLQNSGQHPEK